MSPYGGTKTYASAREYLEPFLKWYRGLFWFDVCLAALHLPLLVWAVWRYAPSLNRPLALGWLEIAQHLSIAVLGIAANVLLLMRHRLAVAVAFGKSAYVIILRLLTLSALIPYLGHTGGMSYMESLEAASSAWPVPLTCLVYQGFYAWCVYLNRKWGTELEALEQPDDRWIRDDSDTVA